MHSKNKYNSGNISDNFVWLLNTMWSPFTITANKFQFQKFVICACKCVQVSTVMGVESPSCGIRPCLHGLWRLYVCVHTNFSTRTQNWIRAVCKNNKMLAVRGSGRRFSWMWAQHGASRLLPAHGTEQVSITPRGGGCHHGWLMTPVKHVQPH